MIEYRTQREYKKPKGLEFDLEADPGQTVPNQSKTIPEIIAAFTKSGMNEIFEPEYSEDERLGNLLRFSKLDLLDLKRTIQNNITYYDDLKKAEELDNKYEEENRDKPDVDKDPPPEKETVNPDGV